MLPEAAPPFSLAYQKEKAIYTKTQQIKQAFKQQQTYKDNLYLNKNVLSHITNRIFAIHNNPYK